MTAAAVLTFVVQQQFDLTPIAAVCHFFIAYQYIYIKK